MSNPLQVGEKLHSSLVPKSKEDIQVTLARLALPIDEYFVIGGANLVLRGIKPETPDIDALVSRSLFNVLAQTRGVVIKPAPLSARRMGATNSTVWVERDDLEIPFTATTQMGDGYYPQAFETHKDRVEIVEGLPCVELDVVRESKLALQRPYPASDLRDIELINRYLGISEPLPEPTVTAPHFCS